MILDPVIEQIVTSDDTTVLVELYDQDAVPDDAGFDPADALKLYSSIDVTFAGEEYTRLVHSVGRIKRSITDESNSVSVSFDNLDNAVSAFELDPDLGFEGKILVIRLISRSISTTEAESLILFVGRCEKPKSGTRESLSVSATQVFSSIETEIPRRKFSPEDDEGRHPSDPYFEGFRFMPQYGVTTYSVRQKRGGLLGFLGFKKTVTKTLSYSSFSDLDAEKFVPFGFGRVQVMGSHVAYQDIGTGIRATTVFMEGPIEALANLRTDDTRFFLYTDVAGYRLGYPPNQGPVGYVQQPHSSPGVWPGDGYYANTAMVFMGIGGSNVDEVDEAPGIITVALGMRVTTPDTAGDWNTTAWCDDAAALTRYVLTSGHYGKLETGWLDDDTFTECWNFNKEPIFDTSYSDVIFLPAQTETDRFTGGESELAKHLIPTGALSATYFDYLDGGSTATETFLRSAFAQEYENIVPIEPIEPPIEPFPGGGGGSSLLFLLRRRYTCSLFVTEQMKVIDFLQKAVFVSARMYITQGPNGKIRLHNKKPVDWALATEALSGTGLAVDDVRPWITPADPDIGFAGMLLIDPNTAFTEARDIAGASYSLDQNSVTLTSSVGDVTIVGFAGCDGSDAPATATVTVNSVTPTNLSIVLDTTTIAFAYGTEDTTITVAAFVATTINAHPVLQRKFYSTWVPGASSFTITAKFGTINVVGALVESHVAPIANPGVAPTGAEAAGGNIGAGVYKLAYSKKNFRGQTLLSAAVNVTVTGTGKKIVTGAIGGLGAGETVNWYLSPASDSYKLRYIGNNDGTAYDIVNLPALNAPLIPDYNRTGAEVMRIAAVFTDREDTRSAAAGSNVLKGTFKWILGRRSKAINRVDVKFRDATQDFRLVELRLKDEAHIAKTKKISKLEVNGMAIDNHNQAYRIAAGLLAEMRDADFFYEWTSDKAALLLEEGDVVAITDAGSGVTLLPVRIEEMNISTQGGFCKVDFTARKYSTTLYDDSVAERQIPVILDSDVEVQFV
jgi:hypothetical protein